jgi:hypothetical protein
VSDLSLSQGKSASYTLPLPEDNENQKIYLNTYEKGQSTLPKFMKYEASTRTYQISTSLETKPDNYLIEVSLSDTFALENIYSFTVKVMQEQDS